MKVKVLRVIDVIGWGLLGVVLFSTYQKIMAVPDRYMVVNKVYIEDSVVGVPIDVVYDRRILQAFGANWKAKIYNMQDLSKIVCDGGGFHYYEPSDVVSDITLSWYMNKDKGCSLLPGKYIAKTNWIVTDKNSKIVIHNTSNVFTIYEKNLWNTKQLGE